MATEQPAVTVLSRPRQQSPSPGPAGQDPSEPVEFRGFDYFSNREYNQYKDASRAYFGAAEKNGDPSSWLGDATPPHRSLDEPRSVDGGNSGLPNDNDSTRSDEGRIIGLRRPWFWTVLATVIVLVLVIIGVGVGVGTTQHANNKSTDPNAVDGATYVCFATDCAIRPSFTFACI
jgi:hypothetical protein